MSKTVAVIPARGGSKRIPRKNMKTVNGDPLIAHAVNQAKSAEKVDETIVSTDDDEIAITAREYGATSFRRPAELATDDADTEAVVTHALNWIREDGKSYEALCLIQPTSPLRTPDDIDTALYHLFEEVAQSVISVSKYITPPQWAVTEGENGRLTEYFDFELLWAKDTKRTQELPDLQHPNGAIFAATTEAWETHESFYTPETIGYEMPPERSFDIDEPWELELVRDLME